MLFCECEAWLKGCLGATHIISLNVYKQGQNEVDHAADVTDLAWTTDALESKGGADGPSEERDYL